MNEPEASDVPVGSMMVWVTAYQEDPHLLRDCLQSLADQDYRGTLKFVIVDDGSYLAQIAKYGRAQEASMGPANGSMLCQKHAIPVQYKNRHAYYVAKRRELLAVFDGFRHDSRFEFILPVSNAGKRRAQQLAWLEPGAFELYGTVDSDTVLDTDALTVLASNFRNPEVAAATGYVDVSNATVNLLTRLIDMRYWSAFHVERAAQSYHKAVMCCSGPLSIYRAQVVDQVMDRYVTQRFLNKLCTFGDDRHLTNLILTLGHRVVMDPRAHCLTAVPTTLGQYIKQQVRWNKSFYREMLWTVDAIRQHSWYMTYDLIMQFCLPFLLIAALAATVAVAVGGGGLATVALYLGTVCLMGLVRSMYGAIMRRRMSYALFMVYGLLYVGLLIPVRLYALTTLLLGHTHWGTRER